MEFKTIERVPIVSTGTYPLGSGETTFTKEDLASAVLAASDPTVSAPRIKIGHLDERFEADESLDGEPAMGVVKNMALTDDGNTIVADLDGVPSWLADAMPTAYPGRSIEGGFGYTAPSGRTYKLAISKLALLGTTWPGVGSLADLREVLEHNGKVEAGLGEGRFVGDQFTAGVGNRTAEERREMAKKGEAMEDGSFPIGAAAELESAIRLARTPAQRAFVKRRAAALGKSDLIPDSWTETKAALDVGGIPRIFAADLDAGKIPGGEPKWWPRSIEAADDGSLSIIVDTDTGKLIRLPIAVADDALSYGEASPVVASTGALDAEQTKGPRVLASWPSNTNEEVKTMKIKAELDQAKLAKRLGLAEDATEADIEAALASGSDEAATPSTPEPEKSEKPEPVAASTGKLPEGVVAIDAGKLHELEAGAQAGANVQAVLDDRERNDAITGAIKGGRIVAASRETWEKRWKVNRDETRTLLTAKVEDGGLAAVIPVDQIEVGRAGDGEGDTAGEDAVMQEFYARHFPDLLTTTTREAA